MTTHSKHLSFSLLRDAYQQRNFVRLVAAVETLVEQPSLEQWIALKDLFVEDDQHWAQAFQTWREEHSSKGSDVLYVLCTLAAMHHIHGQSHAPALRQQKAVSVWLARGLNTLSQWEVEESSGWHGMEQVLQFHLRLEALERDTSFDDTMDWVWIAMNVHGLLHTGMDAGSEEPMNESVWAAIGFPDEWRHQLQGLMALTSLEGDALQDYAHTLLDDPIAGVAFSLKYAQWLEMENRDDEAYVVLQDMLANLARYPDARRWIGEAIAWFDDADSEIVQALWEQAQNFDLISAYWCDQRVVLDYATLEKLAQRGDTQALLALATCSTDGQNNPVSEATQNAYALMAARMYDSSAIVYLARHEQPAPGHAYHFLNESVEQETDEAYAIGAERLEFGRAVYQFGTLYAPLPGETTDPLQWVNFLLGGAKDGVFEAANILAANELAMETLPMELQYQVYSMASLEEPSLIARIYNMALRNYEQESNTDAAERLLHCSERLLNLRDPENLRSFLPEAETSMPVADVLYSTGAAFATVGQLREARQVWEHASELGHVKASARLGKPTGNRKNPD